VALTCGDRRDPAERANKGQVFVKLTPKHAQEQSQQRFEPRCDASWRGSGA
jgi:hypothetical protein